MPPASLVSRQILLLLSQFHMSASHTSTEPLREEHTAFSGGRTCSWSPGSTMERRSSGSTMRFLRTTYHTKRRRASSLSRQDLAIELRWTSGPIPTSSRRNRNRCFLMSRTLPAPSGFRSFGNRCLSTIRTPPVPSGCRSFGCGNSSGACSGCSVGWRRDCRRRNRIAVGRRTHIWCGAPGFPLSCMTWCSARTSTCRCCCALCRRRSCGDDSGWRCGTSLCRTWSTCRACRSVASTWTSCVSVTMV